MSHCKDFSKSKPPIRKDFYRQASSKRQLFSKYCENPRIDTSGFAALKVFAVCVLLWELQSDNHWLLEKLGKKLAASPGAQQMSAQSGILSKYCQHFHQIRLFSPAISRLWVKLSPA